MSAGQDHQGVSQGPPELWILRHGETEWNRESRLQGRLDSPLTTIGVAQAQAQGDILTAIDLPADIQMLSSPSGRALRTAEIVNAKLSLPLAVDEGLAEIDIGEWQGQTLTELSARNPGLAIEHDPHLWKFDAPGGEGLEQMCVRLDGVLRRLRGPAVLITHGVTSRVLRTMLLGLPPEALSSVPGGQGIVHHVIGGKAQVLRP